MIFCNVCTDLCNYSHLAPARTFDFQGSDTDTKLFPVHIESADSIKVEGRMLKRVGADASVTADMSRAKL